MSEDKSKDKKKIEFAGKFFSPAIIIGVVALVFGVAELEEMKGATLIEFVAPALTALNDINECRSLQECSNDKKNEPIKYERHKLLGSRLINIAEVLLSYYPQAPLKLKPWVIDVAVEAYSYVEEFSWQESSTIMQDLMKYSKDICKRVNRKKPRLVSQNSLFLENGLLQCKQP